MRDPRIVDALLGFLSFAAVVGILLVLVLAFSDETSVPEVVLGPVQVVVQVKLADWDCVVHRIGETVTIACDKGDG